jgi:PhzF family phenazine biosynthesis protein
MNIKRIPIYQVDAFTDSLFRGNPAAVCPLERWPDDRLLQSIAEENNLSETAFFVPEGDAYRLRWFTPAVEVDLCGHATLATAHVIFTRIEPSRDQVEFTTRSGRVRVTRDGDMLSLDFPSRPAKTEAAPEGIGEGLGAEPEEVLGARDIMAVFDAESRVRSLQPDMVLLAKVDAVGIIATAPGDRVDFVSRFFAPRVGIPEDPVTGSAHCTLVPYWSSRLGKKKLHALQVSPRGGTLFCEDLGERVRISGRAVTYLVGAIRT